MSYEVLLGVTDCRPYGFLRLPKIENFSCKSKNVVRGVAFFCE